MKNRKILLMLAFLSAFPVYLTAENENGVSEVQDPGGNFNITSPGELLGLSPEEAIEKMGSPSEVFSMRGDKEWQDDVVFYYKNHLYLFWFKNRIWQFRVDKRFQGTVMGIKSGTGRSDINKLFGKPLKNDDSSEIYLNPLSITRDETGYPVRIRIYYDENNKASDIYVYRGDF